MCQSLPRRFPTSIYKTVKFSGVPTTPEKSGCSTDKCKESNETQVNDSIPPVPPTRHRNSSGGSLPATILLKDEETREVSPDVGSLNSTPSIISSESPS